MLSKFKITNHTLHEYWPVHDSFITQIYTYKFVVSRSWWSHHKNWFPRMNNYQCRIFLLWIKTHININSMSHVTVKRLQTLFSSLTNNHGTSPYFYMSTSFANNNEVTRDSDALHIPYYPTKPIYQFVFQFFFIIILILMVFFLNRQRRTRSHSKQSRVEIGNATEKTCVLRRPQNHV